MHAQIKLRKWRLCLFYECSLACGKNIQTSARAYKSSNSRFRLAAKSCVDEYRTFVGRLLSTLMDSWPRLTSKSCVNEWDDSYQHPCLTACARVEQNLHPNFVQLARLFDQVFLLVSRMCSHCWNNQTKKGKCFICVLCRVHVHTGSFYMRASFVK